jgi:alanine dehydrogenase
MIGKVKEPQPQEIAMLELRHLLFTYLHLAADKAQAEGLMNRRHLHCL